MTPEQFCYWLQGFIELHEKPPTAAQWKSIKEHLARAFKKETPPVDSGRVRPNKKHIVKELQRHPPMNPTLIC